jgi:TfoX/Sxy family transcriptional regulator of competence genes
MATDHSFMEFIAEQLENCGNVRYRKMFGEYALYIDEKVTALVCDNQLFVKKTEAGAKFIGEYKEGFPYPGAKAAFLIEEQLEDRIWLSELMRITAGELPMPKPKKMKSKK